MLTPRSRVTTRTRNSRHDPAVESLSHGADPVTPWRVANLCRRPCEYQILSARLDRSEQRPVLRKPETWLTGRGDRVGIRLAQAPLLRAGVAISIHRARPAF